MNAFIDECISAGLRVEGEPKKMVDLQHNMDKAAGIKHLFIHIFYQSCTPNDWRVMMVVALNIKTCEFTYDAPTFKETAFCGEIISGLPTKERLVGVGVNLIKILKTLKFDKMTGKFTTSLPYFVPELSSADECCVCMEKTKTKTNCGHTLCAECWHNLREDTCPMCRDEGIRVCECNDDDCEFSPE